MFAALAAFLFTYSANAAVSNELIRENFQSSICNIESMNVSFKIDEAFGEPLVSSKMEWTAGRKTSNDCLSSNTQVWIKVRTELDALRYIRLRPQVPKSGAGFGTIATESPSWTSLLCDGPSDSASCEPEAVSKRMVSTNLKYEGLHVFTEALAVSQLSSNRNVDTPRSRQAGGPGSGDAASSLESMLAFAIDSAIDSGGTLALRPEPESEEILVQAVAVAEPTIEELAIQEEELAKKASSNAVALISTSLAQYTSPAHRCESSRTVENWIRARNVCQFNFRSEANHDYLCADNGQARAIKSTRDARVNFAEDILDIPAIRYSFDGWAALVLEFNSDLQSTAEGDFTTSRWQFTADEANLDDLKQLATSLAVLKEFCEAGSS